MCHMLYNSVMDSVDPVAMFSASPALGGILHTRGCFCVSGCCVACVMTVGCVRSFGIQIAARLRAAYLFGRILRASLAVCVLCAISRLLLFHSRALADRIDIQA